MPKKEHFCLSENSKSFPENQTQMQRSQLLTNRKYWIDNLHIELYNFNLISASLISSAWMHK